MLQSLISFQITFSINTYNIPKIQCQTFTFFVARPQASGCHAAITTPVDHDQSRV